METRRGHVIDMQELYNPATFLDSSCFSELYQPTFDDSSDNSSSYYHFRMSTRDNSNSHYHLRMSTRAQRKMKAAQASKKRSRPPMVAGMQATPIPLFGCSTQQRFLSHAIPATVEQSVEPLLLQTGQILESVLTPPYYPQSFQQN